MKPIKRALFIAGVVVLCAWTIVPIYLVALGALGGEQVVYAWPKPFWPLSWSVRNLSAFLAIQGIWPALLRSVEVAALCMAFSIALGTPAGYALARFAFAGSNVYRLSVLLTRAFPVGILALPLAVSYVRLGLYDTALGVALIHTTWKAWRDAIL